MESSPSEFAPRLFSPQMRSVRTGQSALNVSRVTLDAEAGQVVVFPSKMMHQTTANEDDEIRISISADIAVVLKDGNDVEMLMPPLERWRKI